MCPRDDHRCREDARFRGGKARVRGVEGRKCLLEGFQRARDGGGAEVDLGGGGYCRGEEA